ncbi:MAG: OmpA family protein [Lewinellaceae bacterium]|nr:OmpA family protein [Lewinellaceae bacterium]
MPLKLTLSIALFLIWGFVSWRWYVCGIKQACPEPPPPPEDVRPLVFEWGNAGPIIRPAFEAYRDSIARAALPEGQILEIVGLYFEGEAGSDEPSNLGEGRAKEVKKLFAETLPEERLATSSRKADEPENAQEEPFEAVAFAFIEPTALGDMAITELEGRILIQFPFREASKDIEPEVAAYFEKLARRLNQTGETIRITGHTDSIGPAAANLKLGLARAKYIEDILLSKGLTPSRAAAESKGEEEPVADNSTEDGRKRNRRVEIRME